MSLGDHLRELRNRTIVCVLAIVAGAVVGGYNYKRLYDEITGPVRAVAASKNGTAIATVNFSTPTDAFSIFIFVSLFVGVVLASPVWLWQIWAFIMPGLTGKEKRRSLAFVAAAVPLFLAGSWMAYVVLPKAVEVLLSFAPESASNILGSDIYLSFVLKFILAFGLGFLLPVFLVGLNVAHVMPSAVMIKGWRVAVFLCFLFTAVMTPTPDPWTMIIMALPMIALYFLAVGISYLIDRRRAKADAAVDWLQVADDEASAL